MWTSLQDHHRILMWCSVCCCRAPCQPHRMLEKQVARASSQVWANLDWTRMDLFIDLQERGGRTPEVSNPSLSVWWNGLLRWSKLHGMGTECRTWGARGRGCRGDAEPSRGAKGHIQASADPEESWAGRGWCRRCLAAVWVLGILLLRRWKRLLRRPLCEHRLVVSLLMFLRRRYCTLME
jgi:hypothetical protein